MSQKERNKEEGATTHCETFVNTFWQPYETFHSHVQAECKKQDDFLRQSWKIANQHVTQQREKAQQLYHEMSNQAVFSTQSEAWKNIADQTQAIMSTPINFTLDLIEKTDRQRTERTQLMTKLHDQFISACKQNHLALLRHTEKNMQKLTGV